MTAESYEPSEIERLTGEFFVLPDDVAVLTRRYIDVQRGLGLLASEIYRMQTIHEDLLTTSIKIAGRIRDIHARQVDARGFRKDDPSEEGRDAWCNEMLHLAEGVSDTVRQELYPSAVIPGDDNQFQPRTHLRSVG